MTILIFLTICVGAVFYTLYWTPGTPSGYWEQLAKFLDERDRKIIAKLTNKDRK